jgi:DNA-binding transcriptional MerR regulator
MSMFTVEQLELIRRLRSTGLGLDAIAQAYAQLDQLDADLHAMGLIGPHRTPAGLMSMQV